MKPLDDNTSSKTDDPSSDKQSHKDGRLESTRSPDSALELPPLPSHAPLLSQDKGASKSTGRSHEEGAALPLQRDPSKGDSVPIGLQGTQRPPSLEKGNPELQTLSQEPSIDHLTQQGGIGEIPIQETVETSSRSHSKSSVSSPPDASYRWLSRVLLLFFFGFCTFLMGAALAGSVILGVLDLHSAWIKDLLKFLKEFVSSVR